MHRSLTIRKGIHRDGDEYTSLSEHDKRNPKGSSAEVGSPHCKGRVERKHQRRKKMKIVASKAFMLLGGW